MPTDTPTPKRSWLRRFIEWGRDCNKCDTPDCSNPAKVFGNCEKCLDEAIDEAERSIKKAEHEKLKAAVRAVLLEIEAEK
jgi:hypothetical protein